MSRFQINAVASPRVKAGLAVCFNELEPQNLLITIGQFLMPVTKSYVVLCLAFTCCSWRWSIDLSRKALLTNAFSLQRFSHINAVSNEFICIFKTREYSGEHNNGHLNTGIIWIPEILKCQFQMVSIQHPDKFWSFWLLDLSGIWIPTVITLVICLCDWCGNSIEKCKKMTYYYCNISN